MRRIDRLLQKHCWMDVFEEPWFGGKMRRLFGPVEVARPSAASVIVGPGAEVQMLAMRGRREINLRLPPRRLIPDLGAPLRGAKLRSAQVICLSCKK